MNDSKSPGVVVLGGINMDLVTYSERFPEVGETVAGERFLTYAGGKGANQAVAAARMGARTAMVGRVGDDMFGPPAPGWSSARSGSTFLESRPGTERPPELP